MNNDLLYELSPLKTCLIHGDMNGSQLRHVQLQVLLCATLLHIYPHAGLKQENANTLPICVVGMHQSLHRLTLTLN